MNERNTYNRRDLFKATLGLGAGALGIVGAVTLGNRLGDQTPEASCEDIPVPTGTLLHDVYGNKTDSNELLEVGYAEAVRRQECRDKDGE